MGGDAPGGALAGAESRLSHLSLAQVCDAAYLLAVEQVMARALVDRQAALVAAAMGADVGDLPEPETERVAFDEALNGRPLAGADVDDTTRLARFLGVA